MKPPRTHTAELPRSESPSFACGPRLALARSSAQPRRGEVDAGDANDAEAGDDGVGSGQLDLESVYRSHGQRVSRWAERLAGPGYDIEDIVHDIFLVVQRRLAGFREEAKVSTWLYEITVRVVQSRRRQRRRWRWMWPFRSGPHGTREAAANPLDIADRGPSPLEALEQRQVTELLYQFLDSLDDKYRTAVVLFELEGLPCREIARITGTSVENVWARVSRGRERLIQAFAAAEVERST